MAFEFIELLGKNGRDQMQGLIWLLSKSRISLDMEDLQTRAKKSKAKADTVAAYQSLRTDGSLLLLNDDFRTFFADLNVVGREMFKDSAFKLSVAAEEVAKKVRPSEQDKQFVAQLGQDKGMGVLSGQELGGDVADVAEVAKTAAERATERLEGDEGKTILNRLKQANLCLRQRKDYSQSVSTLSLLIRRYAFGYSRTVSEVMGVAAKDTHRNAELDRAVHHAWALLTSFWDEKKWQKSEKLLRKVMSHQDDDPQFEEMMTEVGNSLQKLLTDQAFFDNVAAKFRRAAREDVLQDDEIHKLLDTTQRVFRILSPLNRNTIPKLIQDTINVFVTLVISAIQYITIPRLGASIPAIDLLLENLIIEPGITVNKTSFLPYRLKVESYNDVDIHRTHTLRTATHMKNRATIKLDGLSMRADEVGFWMRPNSAIFRVADEGLMSFALFVKGIGVHVDVEICRERLEQILTSRGVRVHIQKLHYGMRKSKFSWLSFLFKPLLRPVLRMTMEHQLADSLAE
ncbi:hypothetical protein LTR37_018707 [Vermiconidia calcicola]|uniref:Uncharacterized protein n=1 Tax=Vermiconidia calcicola TaxID=1690605 RepID=A0ACC3MG60_9PEZI|nr:hypothetical protein LTR37_018707 [Vermiconidia calcicola]